MYRKTTLAVLLVLAGIARAEDKKYESREGKFSVLLPANPTTQKQTADTPAGKLDIHMVLAIEGPNKVRLVSYNDYPDLVVKALPTEKHLDNVIQGNAKQGKIVSDKKITLGADKLPGREVVIALSNNVGLYRARVFLKGNRLYQVVALGPKEYVESKEVEKYLDSFKIEK